MSHAEVPRSCTSSANSQTAEAPAPCTSSESSPPSQALQGFSIVMASTHSTQSNTHNMHRQAREYTSQHLQPIATSSRETKLTHLLIEVDQALPVIRSIASCWLAERCRGGGRRALAKHGALSWLTGDRGRGRGHRCRCSCGSCLAESRCLCCRLVTKDGRCRCRCRPSCWCWCWREVAELAAGCSRFLFYSTATEAKRTTCRSSSRRCPEAKTTSRCWCWCWCRCRCRCRRGS